MIASTADAPRVAEDAGDIFVALRGHHDPVDALGENRRRASLRRDGLFHLRTGGVLVT